MHLAVLEKQGAQGQRDYTEVLVAENLALSQGQTPLPHTEADSLEHTVKYLCP